VGGIGVAPEAEDDEGSLSSGAFGLSEPPVDVDGADPDPDAGVDGGGAVVVVVAFPSPEAALGGCKGFTQVVSWVDELKK
jgi:hypothetical protein